MMAKVNINKFERSAPNLLLPNWALDKLLQLPTEEMAAIVRASIKYFQKGETPDFSNLPTPWILELIFQDIKRAIDENESKYLKRTEASRRGGKNTQAKNRAARDNQPTRQNKTPVELPTLNNIIAFAEAQGYGRDCGQAFWDYNANSGIPGSVDRTEDGEYYLKLDTKGNPLYNWQSAFIGYIGRGYDRAEWEREHGIDPRTHKPIEADPEPF